MDDEYDFWELIGIDPETTMENWNSPSNKEIEESLSGNPQWLDLLGKYGDKALGLLKDKDGKYDLAKLGALGIAAYGMANQGEQGGYNKPVPKMDMVRDQIQYNDPNRRPGEAGRQYFTDPRFSTQGNAESYTAAKDASAAQGQGILAAYQPRPAQAPNPYAGKMSLAFNKPTGAANTAQASEAVAAQPEQGLPGALKSASSMKTVERPATPASPTIAAENPNWTIGSLENDMLGKIEYLKMPQSINPTPVSGGAPNPAEEAMRARELEPRKSSPGDVMGPGMIENPEYLARAANPNPIMDMRYVPRYVSKNEQANMEDTLKSMQTASMAPGFAAGGIADAGRYLQGKTDGMADEIPSSIDGEQPAALSHGEFVIPADVVSHLGNGNSDAGAQKLYEMMSRIRQARTGSSEQGKEINAEEFTMGGLAAAYAGGGAVKGFDGTTGSTVNATGGSGAAGGAGSGGIANDVSRTSTLSPWVGDYVTNALGQGAALAAAPYQAYQGPLTAGASGLQQQAFAGASEMAQAGYQPGQFTGGFNAQTAQQYMNPYLQASLDPQLKELQRQSDIARIGDASRLTKAGAFGGSRQAIMESEGRRNLLDKQQDVLGTGYKTAYEQGLGQFNKERGDEEASRQFGANFGLKSVDQLAGLGATERGITSEGIAADKAQFEEQRDFAYGMPKYQLGLLSGLPIGANTTSVDQDALSKMQSTISGLGADYTLLEKALASLGQSTTK